MTSLNDLQAMAYNAAALPTLKKQVVNQDAAIFKAWLADKSIGVPVTAEIALDDGTTAVVFSSGKIAHWLGNGPDVEVV